MGSFDHRRRICRLGEPHFKLGKSTVLEAQVGLGGFEPIVEGAVVRDELTDTFSYGRVLDGDSLEVVLCPSGSQVPDAAKEFAQAEAVGEDLGEAFFSASSAVSTRSRQVASCEASASASGHLR